MVPGQPAGCLKMPSSAAAASEAAKRILRRTTYVEPLSDARAKLADCFNILLGMCKIEGWGAAARTEAQMVPPSWNFLDCGDSRCS
jgi:hypothetical protein